MNKKHRDSKYVCFRQWNSELCSLVFGRSAKNWGQTKATKTLVLYSVMKRRYWLSKKEMERWRQEEILRCEKMIMNCVFCNWTRQCVREISNLDTDRTGNGVFCKAEIYWQPYAIFTLKTLSCFRVSEFIRVSGSGGNKFSFITDLVLLEFLFMVRK